MKLFLWLCRGRWLGNLAFLAVFALGALLPWLAGRLA